MKNVLIINGSLGGKDGNSNEVISHVKAQLKKTNAMEFKEIFLNQNNYQSELENILEWADGFIFTSGTYWDSWGSPMQAFLENCTEFEGGPVLFKKPASVIITMHSVGGKRSSFKITGRTQYDGTHDSSNEWYGICSLYSPRLNESNELCL